MYLHKVEPFKPGAFNPGSSFSCFHRPTLTANLDALFSSSHCASLASLASIFAWRCATSSGDGPSSGLNARYAFFHVFRAFGGLPGFSGAHPGSYHSLAQCGHLRSTQRHTRICQVNACRGVQREKKNEHLGFFYKKRIGSIRLCGGLLHSDCIKAGHSPRGVRVRALAELAPFGADAPLGDAGELGTLGSGSLAIGGRDQAH